MADDGEFREIDVTAETRPIENWRKQVVAGQPETGRMFSLPAMKGVTCPAVREPLQHH